MAKKSKIYGIGYLGNAKHAEDNEFIFRKWSYILKKVKANNGVICDRWKCFEYFLEDVPKIKNYDLFAASPKEYYLTNRIYSNENIYDLEHVSFESVSTIQYMSTNNMHDRGVKPVGKKFKASVTRHGKYVHLGIFKTREAAAKAVDDYLISIGDTSYLNDANPSIDKEKFRSDVLTINNIDTSKIYYTAKLNLPFRLTGNFKRHKCKKDAYSYEIEFIKTGYRRYIGTDEITRGLLRDPMNPSVNGIGVDGIDHIGRALQREYYIWGHIIDKISKLYPQHNRDELISNDIVDEKFLCFKDFLEELKKIEGYDLYKRGVRCRLINIYEYTTKVDYKAYEFIPFKKKKRYVEVE